MAVSQKRDLKESSDGTMFHGCWKEKKIEGNKNGDTVAGKEAWRLHGNILPRIARSSHLRWSAWSFEAP